jgi:hypothetical protein
MPAESKSNNDCKQRSVNEETEHIDSTNIYNNALQLSARHRKTQMQSGVSSLSKPSQKSISTKYKTVFCTIYE